MSFHPKGIIRYKYQLYAMKPKYAQDFPILNLAEHIFDIQVYT